MKHKKNQNPFLNVGFNMLLWIGLLYASLEALGQVPETAAKSSETAAKPSETAESAELEEEKIEVTKPVPGSLKDFGILLVLFIFCFWLFIIPTIVSCVNAFIKFSVICCRVCP